MSPYENDGETAASAIAMLITAVIGIPIQTALNLVSEDLGERFLNVFAAAVGIPLRALALVYDRLTGN